MSTVAAVPARTRLQSVVGRNGVNGVAACMICADVVAILLAETLAVLGRYAIDQPFQLSFYLKLVPTTIVFIGAFAISGLYPGIALNPVAELQAVFRCVSIGYLLLGASTFFQRDAESYSRLAVLAAWPLSVAFVCLIRAGVRKWASRKDWWGANTVVFTAGPAGYQLARNIAQHPGLGLRIIGILDTGDNTGSEDGLPVLGGFELGLDLASAYGVRYAILAMPEMSSLQVSEAVETYASQFRNVMIIPDVAGFFTSGVQTRDVCGVLGLEVRHGLLYRVPRAAKQMLDLIFSALIAASLAPLFAILWVAVRCTSPGPAMYSSPRIGKDGKLFGAFKFRTMVANAQDVLERHLEGHPESAEEWARDRKLRADPRITPVGRFLRRTSLDELPQIWNVLRGQMSLVGPRPMLRDEKPRYGNKYHMYIRVKPGITGLWQVSGRNNTPYAERLYFTEYYVRNWSIWLDLYILARTVKVVLTGDGAY